jgi:hypothetical protein
VSARKREPGSHGAWPLSDATRRRLLSFLLREADSGNVAAAESLVRLSFEARRANSMEPPTHDTRSVPALTVADVNRMFQSKVAQLKELVAAREGRAADGPGRCVTGSGGA